ncbi:MAG: ribonuclease III [Salinispira sp.]
MCIAAKKRLREFEEYIGVRFKKKSFLNLALSHSSLGSEYGASTANNEKLEFLGDSVLGLVVAEYLYRVFPGETEGKLAKIKSFVVSEDRLASIAVSLHVDEFIIIGKSEEKSGGRQKKAILADAMEAVIGAYFLDSGFKRGREFVLKYWIPEIEKVVENRHYNDYKSLLQEYVQKEFKSHPKYQLTKKTGPDHAKIFWMKLNIQDKTYGPCKGYSKKEAEKKVAERAYRQLVGR